MNETDVFLIVAAFLGGAFALLLLAWSLVWLDILRIKLTDPERYARFVDLRRARKGK